MDYEALGNENRYIRGFILRSLVLGSHNRLAVKQITDALITHGKIIVPDISKQVDYLIKAGYVAYVDQKMTAYSRYAEDGVIELTKAGVDLVEQTIDDDGVDL